MIKTKVEKRIGEFMKKYLNLSFVYAILAIIVKVMNIDFGKKISGIAGIGQIILGISLIMILLQIKKEA